MRSNMDGQARWSTILVLSLCLLLAQQVGADGLAITYCSPDNVSGDYQSVWAQYQTTGLCGNQCRGSYAFAVVQGNYCWCTNYAPADQSNTYLCNQLCPGDGNEWCGNTDAGLYGYFLLDGGQPLGTAGSGSSSAASTSSSFSSSTLDSTSPTSTPETTPSPTAVYTSVTTVTGQVRTVIVTPSATADATLGQASTSGGSGVSAGKVAGIVIGVALGLGLIVGGVVWWWLRRRNRERSGSPDGFFSSQRTDGSFSPQRTDGSSGTVPSRQLSQMSQAGLLGKKPRIQTAGLAPGNDPRSADTMSSNVDRRSLGTDQRLNPYALYSHDEAQLSSVSLQDNQDYSRQLRIANPDP